MFAVAIDILINPIHFKLTISYMATLICIKKRPQFTSYSNQLPFKKVGTVACGLFQRTWNMPNDLRI